MTARRLLLLGVASLVVVSSVAGLGLALSGTPAPVGGPAADGEVPERPADVESVRDAGRTDGGASPDDDTRERNVPSDAARIVTTAERPTFASAKKQVIRGQTRFSAGTELVVVVVDRDQEYLLYDTTTVDTEGTFRESVDLQGLPPGSSATLIVYHDGEQVVNRTIDVVEPREKTEMDSDWNWVYASPGYETISGTTDLAAGTELTVTLHAVGDRSVHENRTVTVRSDGTFEASFDLDEFSNGDNFRVSVSHDGTRLDYARGIVFD